VLLAAMVALAPADEPAKPQAKAPLRAGIIGLDTSHCTAFTGLLNAKDAPESLQGVRVVAAYPGGSPDIPDSKNRVGKYTEQMRTQYGVKIVDSIEELLKEVDVVLLESVDGRPHLRQVIPVLKAGKPVFIDKPIAASLADAILIFELAKQQNVPCFSSSGLRFSPGIRGMKDNKKLGKVLGCEAFSPCSTEPHHPDLFWYGIHGVETLYTIMGPGCVKVVRTHTPGADVVTGTWKDGRIGTFRGIRAGHADFGATVYGSKAILPSGGFGGYRPLVEEIVAFFKSGKAPVSAEETIELVAFMEAADESKRQGGAPVTTESVMEKARAENAKRKVNGRD
jgi:predicted dehydrogenase